MMIKNEKVSINTHYRGLKRNEKSQFVKEVMDRCDICYTTVFYKLSHDNWSKLEREAIEKMIQNAD